MVRIEEMLFLNQAAQNVLSPEETSSWYGARREDEQKLILGYAIEMARQAGAIEEDVPAAIAASGLKPTITAFAMLRRSPLKAQLNKLTELPSNEWERALFAVLALFQVANARRVSEHPEDRERHWWNWDLSDERVVARVRRLYREGNL